MFNADLSTILDRMTEKYCAVPIKDQPEIEAVEMTSRSAAQEITSQGHHTSDKAEDIVGVSVEDKELLNELTAEENKKTSSKDKNRQAKIQRVPTIMLRQANAQEYYKPRAMVIGPLHCNISTTLLEKKLKIKLTATFIKASGQTGERLLREIKNNINGLKEQFDENLIESCSDETLARMLFLDGCSILQFINSFLKDDLNDFEINNGAQATLIQQDLFLLENQIPFQVLMLLMRLSDHGDELMTCIDNFILVNHLLRSAHFSMYRRSFRNVQDLKAAGIKFKPSNSRSLRAISFSTRFFTAGQLKLPPLIVDDSTVRKLWNLVAFEMCPDNNRANFGVTSYLSFLDSLIDTEQDVKDLRSAHIIRNRLNSDAEVAELFNTIGSNLVPDEAYFQVKNKIQRYYERRSSTWMAQVCREHFRNPWTITALLAAITLLLLTTIQTWYAVYPKK
ncbi:hypothetical protein TIFTF001_030045 [Ficus carica]|uniref:Uncharacterized protein n=1 Tax=Ficus carica TaxID=3494 RepID=A0AA88IZ25_FICCA|nr:hypothetical protein TIFTF001_030045 [Ficus carica]